MQFEPDLLRRCWFLAGPTAAGKSDLALQLALRLGADIVALDSMSLYRGMDIGTAKLDEAARRAVPHHLIDILDPHEDFSVADYVAAARDVCRTIAARGNMPLFVGGTGLYLRGVLRGVFKGPPADWPFRRQLEAEAAVHGPEWLHDRLQQIDPAAAARLHPRDTRRIVRALEVHHVTGRPLSEQQHQQPLPRQERPPHVYWLEPPRDWLYERINRRVESMFAAGLVEEVRRLLAAPQPLGRTARQALGYKEVIEHLLGRHTLEDTIELVQRRTRQFAKRQHTWFRNLVECRPIPMTGNETPAGLADRILAEAS